MTSLKQECSNMTKANKYISDIIKSFKNDIPIENEIIKDLIKYHPTKNININDIEWLKFKLRPPFNTKSLFYKYKNNMKIDDISWKLCIKNLYGKYNRNKEYLIDVNTVFRNESHIGKKKQYFINHTIINNDIFTGICDNCRKNTTNITTDHYPLPFKNILDSFIDKNKINLYDIDIFENKQNEIRIKDNELASKWLKYHDDIALYRLLCKSCNSHFGSYEYK